MLSLLVVGSLSLATGFIISESWIGWRNSKKHIVIGDHVYWLEDGVKISGVFLGWIWRQEDWPPSHTTLYGEVKINIDLENEGQTKEILGKKLHLMPLPKLKKEKQIGYETYRG